MSTPLVQQPSQPITLQNPRMSRAPGPHLQHSFDLPFHLPQHHQPPPQPAPAHSSFSSASGFRKASGPPLPPTQSIRTSPPGRSYASPPSSLHSSNSTSSMASPPPNMYGIAAPYPPPQQQPQHYQHHQLQQPQQGQARRTLSNATSNSSNSQNRTSVRRSSSNRSSGQHPTSYVALLRKQKATVWCDRSQAEDPRILAAQRLAKERAEREVTAGPGGGSHRVTPPNSHAGSFTSGVARKIRHHGAQKLAAPFSGGGNLAGAGVPLRLSSTEIDDDDDEFENDIGAVPQHGSMSRDDDWGVDAHFYGRGPETHRRTGSGRSSNGSRSNTMGDRYGTSGSMPANGQGHHRSPSDVQMSRLDEKTPVATDFGPDRDYFNASGKESDASSPEDEEEREKREDELRRRGSVDDRAMTMSGVRLFVANPDLDD